METKADYITRQRMADEAERQAQRAGDAIRIEQAQAKDLADYLLGVMGEMPGVPEDMWRYALQQVYERLGENRTNNPV